MMNSKWDNRFMEAAKLFSSWSRDPSTKVGAVIVDTKRRIIGTGYNGFPRGVIDHESRYLDKTTKYAMTVHAEANAILNAVALVAGAILYCTQFPCSDCAKVIIQAGIKKVVAPAGNLPGWEDSQKIARLMFEEAGVEVAS